MVARHVATRRPGAHRPAVAAGQGTAPRPTNKGEPRAPAPDHLVLCSLDCARPLADCHCLRGMLEDRGLAAVDPGNVWLVEPHPDAPGAISLDPDLPPSPALLLIALAMGVTAAVNLGLAWWLA